MSNEKLVEKINELKEKRNAVILVHNYQRGEVQDIADFLGDSLGLSQQAAGTDADIIVFCGVKFMAETAKILSPEKTVLMPDINAGCPMADMIIPEELKKLKAEHPDAVTVGYVNTSADVKAELDLCCTSANVIKVITSLKDYKEIIFVPDKYLGHYASKETGIDLILWNGYCPSHAKILPEYVDKAREEHPDAEVLVHPECLPETVDRADKALSTGGMVRYVKESTCKQFLIGTETGIIYTLKKANPEKEFYPVTELALCPNMKLTNLEKILWCLEDLKYEIDVPEDIRIRALKSVERMIEIV